MYAGPVLEMSLISLTIAELVEIWLILLKMNWRMTYVITLLPAPAGDMQTLE
jgi:hypothetical protein